MLTIAIEIRDKAGLLRPTPAVHMNFVDWSPDAIHELFAVLCERAGAIGGVGVLPANIRRLNDRHVQLIVMTDADWVVTEPLPIPIDMLQAVGYPENSNFQLEVRPHKYSAVDILDVHLAVFAGRRVAEHQLEPTGPYIFGTAFPIWHGGIFATAAHVIRSAAGAGELVLGRLGGRGPQIPAYGVAETEIFEDYDLGLMRCPALKAFPPVTLELETELNVFDEVRALGYPFSIDPDHLVATHRGFVGHIVANRQLYHLPGQPFGYEVSFPTPPGISGAPLIHRIGDKPKCFGFIVQQVDTEFAGVQVRLGLAVSTQVLRTIRSKFFQNEVVSAWFGVEPCGPLPRIRIHRDLSPRETIIDDLTGWPEDRDADT